MSSVELNYGDMWQSQLAAEKGARECEVYKIELQGKVCRKLDSLECGSTGHTSSANYFAKQKIAALDKKKEKLVKHGQDMSSAIKYARETDKNVSGYIKKESRDIRKSNGMKVNIITEFMTWLSTSILNSTTFGRWLNQVMSDIGCWVDKQYRKFKEWYHLDGGKYIMKAIGYALLIVAAVIVVIGVLGPAVAAAVAAIAEFGLTAATVWTLVTAGAAFVSACIGITDCITKCAGNMKAAAVLEDDPGWAQRYGSYDSFADFLRKNNFHSGFLNKRSMIAANRIEMVSTVADIIDFADMAKSGFKFFKNIKENGIHHYFRKMQFKTKNGKVSWDTFKNGSKALIQNIKTIKTEVLDKTTTGRLFDYYKKEHNLDTLYDIMDGIGKVDKLNDWINDKTKKKTPDYNFGGI